MQTSILKEYREALLPWYTIYPTVPEFTATVRPESYQEWLRGLPADDPVSLYLHIPFCRSICWYCGFPTTIARNQGPILDYLAVLRDEIRLVWEQVQQGLVVNDVHFGGGTPTLIGAAEFLAMIQLLRRRFAFRESATIAVEIDPRTFTAEIAEAMGAANVSRASLGVQSFDPIVQKAINRVQSEAQTAAAVEELRRHGVSGINVDLIFGLPNQTVESCVQTAAATVAMRPNRLAVFGYAHIPSVIKNQRLIETTALPDSVARAEQAAAVAETLVAAGYQEIGLDHFALPDDELTLAQTSGRLRRNSLGYSADTCKTLIGFGASAIGRVGEGYVQNEVTRESYSRHIAAGRLATSKGYRLTDDDRVRAVIIERLMCDLQADVPAICAACGFDPTRLLDSAAERLAKLAEDGIVDIENGFIRVRQEHRFVVRAVAAAFDAFLDRVVPQHSQSA
ncbi:oxygen-independent coproporphyrinogen III oxidase [Mesorhizobium australicum WSM2073]|uniref:Coproporphyrinogen-III oxidase n=3 Tax=Mesorhizobium TaxID=68287 RepID=L0KS90_MESAW|nr:MULTISPECIES: oxygen-independent coproporphyrinogen III oxidase [Mesorhizobium]ADV14728.1 oxygen-independent coproporphyrinogen III oxidase [Mesorhizobium ciceri biovar biserrulae WSM1271]AEH90614.1 oxygen-independent coproporphyrinogen III oxidase [Mesorhizobium opportunistum WSM2075]AGB47986.1 oxygen-independent coproporphyrinogen III oxidase [Mesorhizobium australicum WSM2073]OBP89920.1 oxygen-independent coproporphyrinogen III oxidase [Mesorhizobium loti]